MDSPLKQNLKIFLAIIVSGFFIWFFNNYQNFSLEKIFSNSYNLITFLKTKIDFSSFKIKENLQTKSVEKNTFSNNFLLPTADVIYPTKTTILLPTITIQTTNFYNLPTNTQIIIPTIKPTKVPKPTKAPDIFPIDPSLARPGKTPDEVFQIASSKTCVPKEILKAIAYIESGSFFDVVSEKYFLLYNSYDWWNSPFLTEEKRICGGYGYDQNTGIVPNDSKFAGYKCKEGYNSGLNVMGVMSISSYNQEKYGKKVASLLGVKEADRRVILDALIIVGLITKDNVRPASCTNWSGHDIVKAACGYYGSCGIKDGTYYCATFCRNYKKFGGKGSCDASSFGDNCWK